MTNHARAKWQPEPPSNDPESEPKLVFFDGPPQNTLSAQKHGTLPAVVRASWEPGFNDAASLPYPWSINVLLHGLSRSPPLWSTGSSRLQHPPLQFSQALLTPWCAEPSPVVGDWNVVCFAPHPTRWDLVKELIGPRGARECASALEPTTEGYIYVIVNSRILFHTKLPYINLYEDDPSSNLNPLIRNGAITPMFPPWPGLPIMSGGCEEEPRLRCSTSFPMICFHPSMLLVFPTFCVVHRETTQQSRELLMKWQPYLAEKGYSTVTVLQVSTRHIHISDRHETTEMSLVMRAPDCMRIPWTYQVRALLGPDLVVHMVPSGPTNDAPRGPHPLNSPDIFFERQYHVRCSRLYWAIFATKLAVLQ